MHDPLTVAFEIRRPWPRRDHWKTETAAAQSVRWQFRGTFWVLAGRGLYWPNLITVWHREPGGHDALTICRKRVQQPDGTWKLTRGWRLHVHHWRLQIVPLQQLRRRLLTRCAWCGGKSTNRDQVNVSHSWDGPRSRWWQGERGLYHHDCSSIKTAHATCVCEYPVLEHDDYGRCARCNRTRAYGTTAERIARARELSAIPPSGRTADPEEPTR